MNKAIELAVGAGAGAVASVLLEHLIAEVKQVVAFKSAFKELSSTMDDLLPILKEIGSLQKDDDLKSFEVTIGKARVLVKKCSGVRCWNIVYKAYYNRKIVEINKKMSNFCIVQLGLLNHLNLLKRGNKIGSSPLVFTDRCSVPKLDKVPIGLNVPLMKLKRKLFDDAVVSLVVSAAPGCGKTTLVTHLCNDEEIKGKFTHIFFCVVSSAPNIKAIVQHLFQQNSYAPPTFENDSQAYNGLRILLKKLREDGPILLVLDDAWCAAESQLEYFRFNIPGYKILVTSRFDFPGLDDTYRLEPLENKYAETLLVEYALRPDHASEAEYKHLLEKILKRCHGFPLVIKVVGGSLKNRSLTQWQGQVISWSKGGTILNNPTVLECLKPSFEALESNLKECFMDMGSFLEDQKIRSSVIIDIWAELYGNGMTEKDKIIVCMKYLEDLAAHNLLDIVPLGKKEHEDGFYNEFLVTQHDILRELAICQNLERNRERVNLEIKGDKFPDCVQPINARLLSISTDDSFSSTQLQMGCPNVEALVLNLSSSDYALPSFIATMNKLKVLTIMNHGLFPAKLSNFSCLSSLPNLKRIRLEKASITLVDLPQLRFGNLEKLSLVMCSFGEVSHDTKEIDTSEALPNLQEIDIDYCYDLVELPYWVSEVASLKTLSITNCNKLTSLPEAIGNLSELEILRLSSCINLSELPETTERLNNLLFLDISECLELRKLPLEIGKLHKLKKISMRKCCRCELPDSVRNLENLEEVICDEETGKVLWERLKSKMRNLRVQVEEQEPNLSMLKFF